MLKRIVKGLKWFFTPALAGEKKEVSRKPRFAHAKAMPREEYNTRITPADTVGSEPYMNLVKHMEELKISDDEIRDAIDLAKKKLWVPHDITRHDMEVILQNCGFARVADGQGKFHFDPRLIELVTYSMNVYSAQVAKKTRAILQERQPSPNPARNI